MKRTNVVVDEALVNEARKMTGIRTLRELVHEGLRELIARERRKQILDVRNRIEWRGRLEEWRRDTP